MSFDPRVRAAGLGKYFLPTDQPWRHLARHAFGAASGPVQWALRGVDFDAARGDCIGIVGRNGAGKSTLLELVCGILQASEGTVDVKGRVAALLQLGAGFNPEFSGRENVLLAGSLYGLTSAQITERMPAIEAFAGIEGFIDRPVREYSSGMYARLAFAVCAHVDADILVIDEILGVGDVRFQQKSMRFLRTFRRRGIVFFVSHDEHAVSALCNRSMWIDRGRVVASGPTKDVLYLYRREMSRLTGPEGGFLASRDAGERLSPEVDQRSEDKLGTTEPDASFDPDGLIGQAAGGRIEAVSLMHSDGTALQAVEGGEDVRLAVSCRALSNLAEPRVFFAVRNPFGQVVFSGDSHELVSGAPVPALQAGDAWDCDFRFSLPYLPTGHYPAEVFLLSEKSGSLECYDHREAAGVFQMLSRHVSHGMANIRMNRTRLSVGPEAC